MLNKAQLTEITNACTVAFMKARISLVFRWRERKKTEDHANVFFKAFANKFWLISKGCSWFNKVVHGQPLIK